MAACIGNLVLFDKAYQLGSVFRLVGTSFAQIQGRVAFQNPPPHSLLLAKKSLGLVLILIAFKILFAVVQYCNVSVKFFMHIDTLLFKLSDT